MLEIKGELVRETRHKDKCPDDGVHRCGVDGGIKGSHCFMVDGKMVPHGMVGFYWILSEKTGLKVYMNPKKGWTTSLAAIKKIRNRMKKYHKKGIAPKPYGIKKVKVNLKYKDKKFKKNVYALEIQRCHWPEEAWRDYSNGKPYDWSADDHKDHSPEGFIKFKKKVDKALSREDKKTLRKIGDSYKLGDLVWCSNEKKWYLCDLG